MMVKRNVLLSACWIMVVFAGHAPDVRADTEMLGDVTWGYGVADGAATVTNAVPAAGALAIPSVLGGCPVTGIGPSAFSGCTNLASVAFPDGVVDIGEHAFEGCIGLKALSIGDGVDRIGAQAFYGCTGLTTVTIPDGTADIGERAFYGCTGLKTMTVGNGVTNIAPYAFYGCTALRTLGLGDCLATIGDYAFDRCSSLAVLDIPDQVETIGSYAFYGCNGLETLVLGNSVTNIDSHAFYGCSGLESVSLGRNVSAIGMGAFAACSGLSGFSVDAGNPAYASADGVLVTRDMPPCCRSREWEKKDGYGSWKEDVGICLIVPMGLPHPGAVAEGIGKIGVGDLRQADVRDVVSPSGGACANRECARPVRARARGQERTLAGGREAR